MKRLEDEMKLLHWHKLANETAIQTALMRTKVIREEEARLKPILEQSKRMHHKARLNRVREEEESKPLEVSVEVASYPAYFFSSKNIVLRKKQYGEAITI